MPSLFIAQIYTLYVVIHMYKFFKKSFCLLIQFKFIGKYIFMNVLNHGIDYMNTHLVT